MSNKKHKYEFSSANFIFLGIALFCLIHYYFQITKNMSNLWEQIFFWAINILVLIIIFIKFPIFVKIKQEPDLEHNNFLSKKMSFLSKLFVSTLIFAQSSDFVSFFSTRTLIFDCENNKFILKNSKTKFVHKICDIIFGIFILLCAYLTFNFKFLKIFNYLLYGLILLLLLFKPIILDYIYSINIKNEDNYNIFVVHNYGPIYNTSYKFLKNFYAYINNKNIFINIKLFKCDKPVTTYFINYKKEFLSRFNKLKNSYVFIFPIIIFFVPILYLEPSVTGFSIMTAINSQFLSYFLLFIISMIFITGPSAKKLDKDIDKSIVQKIGKSEVLQALEIIQNIHFSYDPNYDFSLPIYKKIEYINNL